MNKFGLRLKQLRHYNKLTQEKFVQSFNKRFNYSLTKSAISQYENQKRLPDINSLINFADYFNVSVDFLLGRTNNEERIAENSKLEEAVANYDVKCSSKPFSIDSYIEKFEEMVKEAPRVTIFNKTATKNQINIISVSIEVGLELARR